MSRPGFGPRGVIRGPWVDHERFDEGEGTSCAGHAKAAREMPKPLTPGQMEEIKNGAEKLKDGRNALLAKLEKKK
jgi:hypothetical protein